MYRRRGWWPWKEGEKRLTVELKWSWEVPAVDEEGISDEEKKRLGV